MKREAHYLLTWNRRHLENAQILRRLDREAARQGWSLPKVCTPLELMGEWTYESEDESRFLKSFGNPRML